MRTTRGIIVAVIAALVVVACGGAQQTPAAPEAPSEVEIVLKEWAIEPQELTVKAGEVTFKVENGGNLEHDFVIEGVEGGKVDLIVPGDSQTLVVNLSPGSYTVICSVPGHKEAGMIGTLTVSK